MKRIYQWSVADYHQINNNYSDRPAYPQDIYWLVEVSNSILSKDLEEKSVIYTRR